MDVDVVFVPTPPAVVDRMIKLAALRADDVVVEARGLARIAGVAERVEIRQADLFDTDLSPATVVMMYLLPRLNARLRPKLLRELRPGSRVVSQSFDIEGWPPAARSRVEATDVYLWRIPTRPAAGPGARGPRRSRS